ncbi:hypothetical protein E4665_06815 [Sporolactobacillus shoreae]|uniref:Helicase ATP-binding domain-containing protein n=1 Tax=Sporolactobacillus shoreae TaxID=1465501 RepID=A0A4Z0GR22_9BACL|nr:hypothetical protein [Sporolactobacillus shoreae]TGA99024.1 hypothetical protein E4665_06815 [Sporolactobacillus shoreae]
MAYLSEKFTADDFRGMKAGFNYGFWSEPDSGKTRMIFEHLVPLAEQNERKILFLYPRSAIGDQLKNKYVSESVDYRTYQSIESDLARGIILPKYDYIVCDEAHYFIEDASFNDETERSFDYINQEHHAIKILLSGTPEPLRYAEFIKPVIDMCFVDYSNHNVEVVFLTRNTKLIERQIKQQLEKGQQTLVFSSSATSAYELSKKFLEHDPFFISSKNNQTFKSKNDEDVRERIIECEQTNRKIGFMTAAMNTGINFNEDVRNVVILGSPTSVEIRQTVARVRKGEKNRKVRLYLQVPFGQAIRTKVETMKRDLEFIDIGIHEWQRKYGVKRTPSFIWHETDRIDPDLAHIKINKMRLAKVKSDISDFASMSSNTVGTYQRIVEKYYPSTSIHWLKSPSESIEKFLEEHIENILVKEDQQKMKEIFKKSEITSRSGTVGPKVIRDYLYQKKKYSLQTKVKSVNGKKQQVWIITKL